MALPTDKARREIEISRRVNELTSCTRAKALKRVYKELDEVPEDERLSALAPIVIEAEGRKSVNRLGEYLVAMNSDSAIQLLIDRNKTTGKTVQTNLNNIAQSSCPVALNYLSETIQRGKTRYRESALKALGKSTNARSVQLLCQLSSRGIAEALSILKRCGSVEQITLRVINDEHLSIREVVSILNYMRILPARTLFRPFAKFDPISAVSKLRLDSIRFNADDIKKIKEQLKESQVLLRASNSSGDLGEVLLRPAANTVSPSEVLLRTIEEE